MLPHLRAFVLSYRKSVRPRLKELSFTSDENTRAKSPARARREEIERFRILSFESAFHISPFDSVVRTLVHLYHTWRFPCETCVLIFRIVQKSIFFMTFWRSSTGAPINIFSANAESVNAKAPFPFDFTAKKSAADCLGELLSISTADRYRCNQREFLPHACFLERIAISRPRSRFIRITFHGRSRRKSPSARPFPRSSPCA